ncbi:MAG: isocitrate lyase/PEP mutase family protein [Thermoanaerobaculia bacterium]|nr:isocitrate lyase/PEP mutase family protein [Thermoanaerobaculia bacterium]
MGRVTDELRRRIGAPEILLLPGCFDALSARLIEQAGAEATFMSGFGVAAARAGLPDIGLLSYGEVLDQGRSICEAVSIPVFGDADTGYGADRNVRRTVGGFARAGFAAVMIEDQEWPKRCGHTPGKRVVPRSEAVARVRAAVAAREAGADVLILARTDALATDGLDEAIDRCLAFADAGADLLFPEAPTSEAEMERLCRALPLPVMANVVEGGLSPVLPPGRLEALGFSFAAYPLTCLSAAMRAMRAALSDLGGDGHGDLLLAFEEVKRILGFPDQDG